MQAYQPVASQHPDKPEKPHFERPLPKKPLLDKPLPPVPHHQRREGVVFRFPRDVAAIEQQGSAMLTDTPVVQQYGSGAGTAAVQQQESAVLSDASPVQVDDSGAEIADLDLEEKSLELEIAELKRDIEDRKRDIEQRLNLQQEWSTRRHADGGDGSTA